MDGAGSKTLNDTARGPTGQVVRANGVKRPGPSPVIGRPLGSLENAVM